MLDPTAHGYLEEQKTHPLRFELQISASKKLTCCYGRARCDKAIAKGQGSRSRHSCL